MVRADLSDISDIDVEILMISSGNISNVSNTSSTLRRSLTSISYQDLYVTKIEFSASFEEENEILYKGGFLIMKMLYQHSNKK